MKHSAAHHAALPADDPRPRLAGSFRRWLAPVLLLCFAPAWLLRDLWFDEALTVMNFALLPRPLDIYLNYAIPNNHIVFTALLNLWIKLMPGAVPPDLWLRLPSLAAAVALLLLLHRRFARHAGAAALCGALALLAVSPPFLTYATAVRGYMTGALFAALFLAAATEFLKSGKPRDGWPCAAFALLAAGVAPSNLAALAAASLIAASRAPKPLRRGRIFVLFLIPPAMTLLFYLPIFRQLIHCYRLGEGWHDGAAALKQFAVAALLPFLPILVPALAGGAILLRRRRKKALRALAAGAVWLLPAPMMLLPRVAPFPRVFLPLLPFFALLAARGISHFAALLRLRRRSPRRRLFPFPAAIPAILAALWGMLLNPAAVRVAVSERIGGAYGDDFFAPYYLRTEFRPAAAAAEALRRFPAEGDPVLYLSFNADPWAVSFYCNIFNTSSGRPDFRFDGPRGTVPSLPDGAAIVLRFDEDPAAVARRFGGIALQAAETKFHRIFRLVKR